jgi:hypothetical protein
VRQKERIRYINIKRKKYKNKGRQSEGKGSKETKKARQEGREITNAS